jgi:putative ABC transport system permease protein
VWLVRNTAPADLPRFNEARLDPTVLLFALASSVLAAVLAGMLPAFQASHVAPAGELKDGGRAATSGLARLRWRQALVATEIALALVLVCGAGLMVRTVSNLFAVDAGIDPKSVLTMRLSTPGAFYADSLSVERFHAELTRQVAALPGVKAVGTVRNLPLSSEMGDWGVGVEGYVPPPNTGTPADWQVVGPGYFEAMGLSLKQGRFLEARDELNAPLALVVNERFVELYIAGRNPIGRKVVIGGSPDSLAYRIVGVVGNVHHNGLTRDVKAQFYAPVGQFARAPGNTTRSFSLVVRSPSRGSRWGCSRSSACSRCSCRRWASSGSSHRARGDAGDARAGIARGQGRSGAGAARGLGARNPIPRCIRCSSASGAAPRPR